MPKIWCLVGFKITELLQKTWYLYNDSENVFIWGMKMHRKPFDRLIILNYRVKSFFFQFLPISTELIFIVRIKQKKKVLNVRNHFLQLEITFSNEKMIRLFLQFSDRVWCWLKSSCNLLMIFQKRISRLFCVTICLENNRWKTSRFNRVQTFETCQKPTNRHLKTKPFFFSQSR